MSSLHQDTLRDTGEGGSNICTRENVIGRSRQPNTPGANTATYLNNNTSFANACMKPMRSFQVTLERCRSAFSPCAVR